MVRTEAAIARARSGMAGLILILAAFTKFTVTAATTAWSGGAADDIAPLHCRAPTNTSSFGAAACAALSVLQAHWYNEILGDWSGGTQFWGSANALSAVVDYALRSGDVSVPRDVATMVHERRPPVIIELLGVGSYDDMQWWSLAYLEAGVAFDDDALIASGRKIFDYVWNKAYDATTCGGGLWWSARRSYKNAITNELALANAALLARRDASYVGKAVAQWQWFEASGMISSATSATAGLVADGLDVDSLNKTTCRSNAAPACCTGFYSYNQGVLLGALADLWHVTRNESLLLAANFTASSAIAALSSTGGIDGILLEKATGVDSEDHALFKGIFARNVRKLADALLDAAQTNADLRISGMRFLAFLDVNARSLLAHARDAKSGMFSALWEGPVDPHAKSCTQPGSGVCGNATGCVAQISASMLLAAAADSTNGSYTRTYVRVG